jgi:hypothetical protein
VDHGNSANPRVHYGLGPMLVIGLTGAHAPNWFRPRGLDGVGENEEGARGIITVASEGGGVAWFGLVARTRRL